MGTKLGGSQLRAEPVGRLSRARNVTLSDFFPVKSDKKKGDNSRNVSPATSRRSRNTSRAMSRRSSVVSWSDSPRDQAVPKCEAAVMEDCTESLQAEINRNIRANDKLRKILTNMPDEHKSLIYGDSLKANMQSLHEEKSCLTGSQKAIPSSCKVGSKNKRITWRESPAEIETKQQHRLEVLQKNGSKLTRNWMQHTPNRSKPRHEMSILVAEQTAENAKAVNQGTSGIQSLSSGANPRPRRTTDNSLSVQICSLGAKHGVSQRCGTANGSWCDR